MTSTHIQNAESPHRALGLLGARFFGPEIVTRARCVAEEDVPEPWSGLLVHHDHMTTSLQRYYEVPVALDVLDEHRDKHQYARKIALTATDTGRVVEVGAVRIDLRLTAEEVGVEILRKEAPLGTILIHHGILRRIEPRHFFEFEGPSELFDAFRRPLAGPIYGRVGIIHCKAGPAIELLEVVAADTPARTQ